uniref:response regulator n=1 Tax=Agathobacter sp. TaxID=2021311 RepID=UPI004057C0D0
MLPKYLSEKEISYEIDTFSLGKEFLELGIELVRYDIIFLDINMDEIDGIVTAQKIREYSSEVYIVFVTKFNECEKDIPFLTKGAKNSPTSIGGEMNWHK